MNKRGFQLAIETVIVMVLAVALLIAIFGFWAYQRGIFSDFLEEKGEKPNVDELVGICDGLVDRDAVYEFCCSEKQVKYLKGEDLVEEDMTCWVFAGKDFVAGRVSKLNCVDVGCGK